MPLSIVNIPGTGTGSGPILRYQVPQEAMLLAVEGVNDNTVCQIVPFLQNSSNATQVCALPVSHVGPQKAVSIDLKIPVGPQQQIGAMFLGDASGDSLWLKVTLYIKDGSQRMGWWQ